VWRPGTGAPLFKDAVPLVVIDHLDIPQSLVHIVGKLGDDPGQPTRQPFAGNAIPASKFDATALALMKVWGAPNLPGNVNNFAGNTNLGGNQKQVNARGDYALGEKQRLFGRYTYWDGTSLPSDPFHTNFGGLTTLYGANSGVFGDTYGLFEGIADRDRVAILLDLLGRKVRVVLDRESVVAA